MATLIQASFGKGEIASALHGRVDTTAYGVALRTARNVIIRAGGGASNRPGLSWIGPVKTHSYAPRLIEFQFKVSDAYVIELGDGYARFIRDDGHVLEADKVITAVTRASPGVVTSVAHGFSDGDEVYISSVVGMTRLNGRRFLVANKTTDTFELNDQVTGDPFDTSAFTAYSSGGTVARVYTITTPYAEADLDTIKAVQSADTMTLTHPTYPIHELTRTAHASWTLTIPTFAPNVSAPAGVSIGAGGASTTRRYRVTALKTETLEESLPGLHTTTKTISGVTKANPAVVSATAHGFTNGDEVEINSIVGMTELNGRRFFVASAATDSFALPGENSTAYTTYVSGGTANQTFSRTTTSNATAADVITWSAVSGASRYSVYLESNGVFGWLGDTEQLTFTNSNMAPDLTISPPAARNPFRVADSYPGAASFYQQRRVFGGSNDRPDTSFYSRTGSPSNFSTSTPSQDDDAITQTLTSRQVNEIRHYIPSDDLLIFTSGSEWQVNSGSDTDFSASTAKQHPQSAWGSSHIAPLVIGKSVLFVTENQASVRKIGFSWQTNGYSGSDIGVLSSHMFETYKVLDWAFARSPDPIVHMVREDGQGVTVTFNEEQEMTAWTRWDTQGKFERVCSLRRLDGELDEAVYFVVKRVINGNVVRYIERTHSRRFTDVRDCFFMDGGLSYDEPKNIESVDVSAAGATSTHFDGVTPQYGVPFGVARGSLDTGFTPLVGAVDSPFITLSLWVYLPEYVHNQNFITLCNEATGDVFNIFVDDLGAWFIEADAAGFTSTLQLRFETPGSFPVGVPVNLQVALDTNHGAGSKIYAVYLNGAAQTPTTIDDAGSAFSIPFTTFDLSGIGVDTPGTGGNAQLNGDVTEWWIAPGQFIDLTDSANRLKFRTAGGKAVALGGDGSSITGTAPLMYFAGNSSAFPTNAGTGGAFVNQGSLSDGAVDFYA